MARPNEIEEAIGRVEKAISHHPSVVVALSGGVDSSLLAFIANRCTKTLAAIADSPTLPRRDLADAITFAKKYSIRYKVFQPREMVDTDYLANTSERCYYCKREMYGKMIALAKELGYGVVMDGTNSDDMKDVRPGLRGARELGFVFPFVEAGVSKQMVRDMSRHLGLQTWDRMSSPCLSSRIPTGTRITPDTLARVEKAEEALRGAGFRVVRVRDHYPEAWLELDPIDLEKVRKVADRLRSLGYEKLLVSKRGYVEPQDRGKFKKKKEEFDEV
jgi:uncharacterized protein